MKASTLKPHNPTPLLLTILFAICGLLALCIGLLPVHAQQPASGSFVSPEVSRMLDELEHRCPPKGFVLDGQCVRVIDGDTLVIRSTVDYHVRLLDCWAPESRTKDPLEKVQGLKAKSRLQQLVEGQRVRVHLPADGDFTDMITMGRVLGHVWTMDGDHPATQDLSRIMVSERLATPNKRK